MTPRLEGYLSGYLSKSAGFKMPVGVMSDLRHLSNRLFKEAGSVSVAKAYRRITPFVKKFVSERYGEPMRELAGGGVGKEVVNNGGNFIMPKLESAGLTRLPSSPTPSERAAPGFDVSAWYRNDNQKAERLRATLVGRRGAKKADQSTTDVRADTPLMKVYGVGSYSANAKALRNKQLSLQAQEAFKGRASESGGNAFSIGDRIATYHTPALQTSLAASGRAGGSPLDTLTHEIGHAATSPFEEQGHVPAFVLNRRTPGGLTRTEELAAMDYDMSRAGVKTRDPASMAFDAIGGPNNVAAHERSADVFADEFRRWMEAKGHKNVYSDVNRRLNNVSIGLGTRPVMRSNMPQPFRERVAPLDAVDPLAVKAASKPTVKSVRQEQREVVGNQGFRNAAQHNEQMRAVDQLAAQNVKPVQGESPVDASIRRRYQLLVQAMAKKYAVRKGDSFSTGSPYAPRSVRLSSAIGSTQMPTLLKDKLLPAAFATVKAQGMDEPLTFAEKLKSKFLKVPPRTVVGPKDVARMAAMDASTFASGPHAQLEEPATFITREYADAYRKAKARAMWGMREGGYLKGSKPTGQQMPYFREIED